jgi:D-tyrosyl-tRNA(Tyr) deacylase
VHSPEIESNKDLEKLFKDQMSSVGEDFSSAASLLLKEEEEAAAARHKKKHGRDLLTTPSPTTTPAEYSPNDEYTAFMISSTNSANKYVLIALFFFSPVTTFHSPPYLSIFHHRCSLSLSTSHI